MKYSESDDHAANTETLAAKTYQAMKVINLFEIR